MLNALISYICTYCVSYKINTFKLFFTETNTEIMEPRIKDYSKDAYSDWTIMSLHNWGENPHGIWKVLVMACVSYTHLCNLVF